MINFITLHDNALYPTRGTTYSVGYDLYCPKHVLLKPQVVTKIALGITLALPDMSIWGNIRDRSSMAMHGVFVVGGVVDPDYTGEISVMLYNSNEFKIQISRNDRIAQMVFLPAIVDQKVEITKTRSTGGFGSTGK